MRLRAPQLQVIDKINSIMTKLPDNLGKCRQADVNSTFKDDFPSWQVSNDGLLSFTVNLATGVGKTKLIGAIIAYLFNSGDSKRFLIVTPRTEIIRKFVRELQPESPKYMFHDPSILPRANVISLGTITRSLNQLLLFNEPNIWVLSPQSFSAKGARIKAGGDDGTPTFEYLKNLNDLVIFFDESHHLGDEKQQRGAWKTELENLAPKLLIGMTASLVGQANLLYSYPLRKCLDEKLYTKSIQIIAEKIETNISIDEQDQIAIRFALNRKKDKEIALQDYAVSQGYESAVRPILLVNCKDIDHAKHVSAWIRDEIGEDDAVLLIHNELKPDQYLKALMGIENSESRIQVVVQVAMLNEGWDVSNVFIICPLRQMNSITLIEQVMGRGLRLPFGHRSGIPIIDELDIICFGRQTVQDLANEAMHAGYGNNAISIVRKKKVTVPQPTMEYELVHKMEKGIPVEIELPGVRRLPPNIELESVSLPSPTIYDLHGFDISDPQSIKNISNVPKISLDEFISATSSSVIKNCTFLSASKDRGGVIFLINGLLDAAYIEEKLVPLSPEVCAAFIKSHLDEIYKCIKPSYKATAKTHLIQLSNVNTRIAKPGKLIPETSILSRDDWASMKAANAPISGWKRCVYEAVPFDVYHELIIARCIDRCPDIGWWFRNLPGMIVLDTPAGRYSPDFAVFIELAETHVLLEVKGDIYAGSYKSDSIIKKHAAELWCEAVSLTTQKPWQYWFLLDSEAEKCRTWSDVSKRSEKMINTDHNT
jgi:superfamily II DNA or RNA helicase